MKRTQIYLDQKDHQDLSRLADASGVSMAEMIRGFVRQGLERQKTRDYSGQEVMRQLAKMNLRGGPRNLSRDHDLYLYGMPSPRSRR